MKKSNIEIRDGYLYYDGKKCLSHLDANGEVIKFGHVVYKQDKHNSMPYYGDMIVVIKPGYFRFENESPEYRCYKVVNISTGEVINDFSNLHMLTPLDCSIPEAVKDATDDIKFNIFKALDLLIGLTIIDDDYTTYYSTKGNVPLVYRHTKADKPVITIENTCKWYRLYVVHPDRKVEILEGFDGWIDHIPLPDDLMEFAEENDMYVDATSLEMIAGRAVMEKEIIATCGYVSDHLYAWN